MKLRPTTAAAMVLGGPISGPLYLRAEKHWRAGDRFLAVLYGIVIAEVWLLLPIMARMVL